MSKNPAESVLNRDMFDYTYKVLDLYPDKLNVYGDTGNSISLVSRFNKYGFKAQRVIYNLGDEFPDLSEIDVLIGNGGSDSSQSEITADLLLHKEEIKAAVDSGLPTLVICGMYQLFGNYYQTHNGDIYDGLGIFDIKTIGAKTRLIGNIISNSSKFGEIIGYENHSGQSFVTDKSKLLSEKTILGVGNNTTEDGEGYLYNNAIGSYLHGPILPKNPQIADWLIINSIQRKTGQKLIINSKEIDKIDEMAQCARMNIINGSR